MLPVYQTILEPPGGNCLQACVASILEIGLDEVPNFADKMNFEDLDDSSWWTYYEDYLEMHGLQPIGIDSVSGWIPRGWHIIVGKSPRGDYDHALIGYKGEAVHDPYPGGNCELREITSLEVFVALRPSNGIKANKELLNTLEAENNEFIERTHTDNTRERGLND